MPDTFDGIVVERTPMRELAHRLVDVLNRARIDAWADAKSGTEVLREGDMVLSPAYDVRVAASYADRARRVIARARQDRAMCAAARRPSAGAA